MAAFNLRDRFDLKPLPSAVARNGIASAVDGRSICFYA
jgi:hypothetical protein